MSPYNIVREITKRVGWQMRVYYPDSDCSFQGPVQSVETDEQPGKPELVTVWFEWLVYSADEGLTWIPAIDDAHRPIRFWQSSFESPRASEQDRVLIIYHTAAEQILIFYPPGSPAWITPQTRPVV